MSVFRFKLSGAIAAGRLSPIARSFSFLARGAPALTQVVANIQKSCLRHAPSGNVHSCRSLQVFSGTGLHESGVTPIKESVFVQLPNSRSFEIVNTTGPRVGDVKEAIIAEFKDHFMGVNPFDLQLFRLDGGTRTLLESTQTLNEAGIREGTRLDFSDPLLRDNATANEVYALLGPRARATVDAAREHRSRLTSVRVLRELRPRMTAASATALGIDVLRADGNGDMTVGMFQVPQINPKVIELPKNAVASGLPLGVHLSGPYGVGKSAIALLAYLLCIARSKLAVYIPYSASWVDAARSPGGCTNYFLELVWLQNADLILENVALRRIFLAVMRDTPAPFPPSVMDALREVVGTPAVPGFAVIQDEVQHITTAVNALSLPQMPVSTYEAGNYFLTNWYDWANANIVFQRMSVASAHSARELDCESDHLLNIEPLEDADRDALQAAVDSPAFVADHVAREHIVFIAGGVLRKLIRGAHPKGLSINTVTEMPSELMWDDMFDGCMKWLNELSTDERAEAAHAAMDLVMGNVTWRDAAGLFDRGLVYRSSGSAFVRPISAAAAAVILRVTALHHSKTRKPLSSIVDGRERGFELERQVLARLDSCTAGIDVPSKHLDGSSAVSMTIRCGYSLPFCHLSERDVPVLYRPVSLNYQCDAILMPASGDSESKICFLECSTTEPVEADRVEKVIKFFAPDGVVTQLLAAARPGRTASVVLFYDGSLKLRGSVSDRVKSLSHGQWSLPPKKSKALAGTTVEPGNSVAKTKKLRGASAAIPTSGAAAEPRTTLATLLGLWMRLP